MHEAAVIEQSVTTEAPAVPAAPLSLRERTLEQVQYVRAQREISEILNQQMVEEKQKFELDHADLSKAITDQKKVVSDAEEQLRRMGREIFDEDPSSKKLAPGISVRTSTVIQYNSEKALEWAIENKLCLALDKSAFEGVAKTVMRPEFVTLTKEPSITIASDLAKALTEAQ